MYVVAQVEGRLKELSDERDAKDLHEEIVAAMDESDAHQRYCEEMKNLGDPAYQDVDVKIPDELIRFRKRMI